VVELGPVFAHLFGIRPWEVGQLTMAEFEVFEDWARAHLKGGDGGG
jgi:hypothetical protein